MIDIRAGTLGLIATLSIGLAAAEAQEQQAVKAASPPAIEVAATEVKTQPWIEMIPTIGIAEARQGVDISGSEGGTVAEILFDSGDKVKVGQPLVRLDSSKEQADLNATQVQIPAAQVDSERKRKLAATGAVSQSDADDALAKYNSLTAQAISLKATITRRTLGAPFAGVVGIRKVNLGQYLNPGTAIVSLQDLDVMRMRFFVAQKDFAHVKIGQKMLARFDSFPGDEFEGKISAIEPSVRYQSGIVPIQAEIPNSDGRLLPGMFGEINIIQPDPIQAIVVPQSAVTFTLYGTSVYVVVEEKDAAGQPILVARNVNIETGERRGNLVVVTKGLKDGDKVVTAGQIRIGNGTPVKLVEGQGLPEMTEVPLQ